VECCEEGRPQARTAAQFDTANVVPSKAQPALFDVRVVVMSPQLFTLTEFKHADGSECNQSWLMADRNVTP
jgi:hypothetical protein